MQLRYGITQSLRNHSGKQPVRLTAKPQSDCICKYEKYVKESAALYYQNHSGDFTIKATTAPQSSKS